MKLVILTTNTPHHTYFVREIAALHPVEAVLSETMPLMPPFETFHDFEAERDAHERAVFFNGSDTTLHNVCDVEEVETINAPAATARLKALDPDVVLVFGTGRIRQAVIDICPRGMINLHGGDPERYRGLDTHLWAIYHSDFNALATTLHHVNAGLDDGDIIQEQSLILKKGMDLSELRALNTRACLDISLAALDMYTRFGAFLSRRQRQRGRYYSFMPACLKGLCRSRFLDYTRNLP